MKKSVISLMLLVLTSVCYSQTPSPMPSPAPTPSTNPSTNLPTFNLNASVISLSGHGQTTPVADVGATFSVTPKWMLRSDNLVGGASLNAYFGGLQYFPTLKFLQKTNLNSKSFQFYLTAGAGSNHVAVSSTQTAQHFALEAGGGLNYDPTGTGKFTVNLFEVKYLKLPGFNNNTASIAGGIVVGIF